MHPDDSPKTAQNSPDSGGAKKLLILGLVLLAAVICYFAVRKYLDFEYLASQEQALKAYYQSNPVTVLVAAFVIYATVTGLAVPGASPMTLIMSWFFGFATSLVLISFASTAGATIAFLISRYLFRDALQSRFGDRLAKFNAALDKEGAFYLFTLRLVPLVPFFVINYNVLVGQPSGHVGGNGRVLLCRVTHPRPADATGAGRWGGHQSATAHPDHNRAGVAGPVSDRCKENDGAVPTKSRVEDCWWEFAERNELVRHQVGKPTCLDRFRVAIGTGWISKHKKTDLAFC